VVNAGASLPASLGAGSHPATRTTAAPNLHFGPDTNRWGPNLSHRKPATIGDVNVDQQTIACPRDMAGDRVAPAREKGDNHYNVR
jgi:hypothetical protein